MCVIISGLWFLMRFYKPMTVRSYLSVLFYINDDRAINIERDAKFLPQLFCDVLGNTRNVFP